METGIEYWRSDNDEESKTLGGKAVSVQLRPTYVAVLHKVPSLVTLPHAKLNMLVTLLACFVVQTKHVNFNAFFVPIKLHSCYLCDIKLVSLHHAVKFLLFHFCFISTFPIINSVEIVFKIFYNFAGLCMSHVTETRYNISDACVS